MDEWQNTLLISLRQDLLGLTSLSKEISSNIPNNNIKSWLYPTKLGADIINHNIDNQSNYAKYLELIIECIYHINNSLLAYLDSKYSCNQIIAPKNMTLAGCTTLLWKLIMQLKESFITKCVNEGSNSHQNKSTQTDGVGIKSCDTCSMALSSIKDITMSIEASSCGVATKIIKKELQLKLCDYTVIGCLSKLCRAIEEDVTNVVYENTKLQHTCSQQNNELIKAEAVLIQNAELIKENALQSESITDLNRTIQQCNNEMEPIKLEVVKLKDEKQCVLRSISHKDILMYGMNKTISQLETEKKDLQEDILCRNNSLSNAANIIVKKYEGILFKMVNVENDFTKRMDTFECSIEKLKKSLQIAWTREYSNIRKLSNTIAQKSDHSEAPLLHVEGNPLDDMMKQIDDNMATIHHIQADNDKLLKTVSRLKRLSFPPPPHKTIKE